MPAPFNDPALQTYSITDFTPGIHRWARGSVQTYSPYAPPGSAAHAYRCWARQDIGLLPFPTYTVCQTYTVTDASNPICLSLGNMLDLAPRGGFLADIVSAFLVQHGHGFSAPTDFRITRLQYTPGVTTPTTIYTNTASTFPTNTSSWPMMDHGVFQDPSTHVYSRTVMTTDPLTTSYATNGTNPGKWLTVRGWTTPTTITAPEYSSGTFSIPSEPYGTYPRIFYHEDRMGIWQVESSATATNTFVQTDTDTLYVAGGPSVDMTPTNILSAGTFYPEMGTMIGAWGSYSTGEYVGIYEEMGGFLIYGDLYAVTSSNKLAWVMGTGGAVGPAALSPVGMIYPRNNEAVYIWSGDNVSTNISSQIPAGQFTRTLQGQGFAFSPMINTSQCSFGDWVVFPNNWVFDTQTGGWWLSEDPNVINFQVNATQAGTALLTSPGIAYADPGQPATLNTYYWTKRTAASSYFWQSNPIPVTTGALVSLQGVEIVASNLTPTPATVNIRATSPADPYPTVPYQNPNDSNVTFDIPSNTSGFRAMKRLGYGDYNIQIAVTAANSTSNAAPTIHGLNIFYTQTRTSGVQ